MGRAPSKPTPVLEPSVTETSPGGEDSGNQQKTRNGKLAWRLRVYDPRNGKQPEKTFYGSYEAAIREQEKLRAEVRARANPQVAHAKAVTLGQWAETWLTQHYVWRTPPAGNFAGVRRPYSTWKNADNIVNIYLLPALGESTRLNRISHKDLTSAIGGLETKAGEPLSPKSKESVAAKARALFRDAVLAGVMDGASPAAELPTIWGEAGTGRTSLIPSINDVEALAAAMDKTWPLPKWCRHLAGPNGEGHGDLVRVLAYTGLRWQELAAMEAGSVHLDRRVLDVVDTASESGGRREHRRGKGKSRAAIRHLAVVDQAVPAIERLLAIRKLGSELEAGREARRVARVSKKRINRPLAERWLLLAGGDQGGFQSYSYWRKQLAKAQAATVKVDAAGQPIAGSGVTYTAHDLRHVCAAILYSAKGVQGEKVISKEQIREQMGHAAIATTERVYRHMFLVDRQEVSQLVSSRIYALGKVELEEAE